MHIRSLLVGALALAASASESQASGLSRLNNQDCTTGALVTCASVQVRFGQFTPTSDAELAIGLRNLGGIAHPALQVRGASRFQDILSGNVSTSLTRPQIVSTWLAGDGRALDCRPGGLDCRVVEDPTTVTPEPVTMALLATGLIGMGGVSGIRRRLNAKRGSAPV